MNKPTFFACTPATRLLAGLCCLMAIGCTRPASVAVGITILEKLYKQYLPYKYVFTGFDVVCFNLAEGYEHSGRKEAAEKFYFQAAEIIIKSPTLVRYDVVCPLMEHYMDTGNRNAMLDLLPAWKTVNDLFYKENTTRQLAIHAVKAKMREKEQQLRLAEKQLLIQKLQNTLYLLLIVLLLALITWGILWWRRRKKMLRKLFEVLMQQHCAWVEAHNPVLLSGVKPLPLQPAEAVTPAEQEEFLRTLYYQTLQVMEQDRPFLCADLSLNDLARLIGTNRTHLSAAINRMTGSNFNLWLAHYRVNYLIGLIQQNPESNVELLYGQAGFASRATFYRHFKQVTGLTPAQFMSQIRVA